MSHAASARTSRGFTIRGACTPRWDTAARFNLNASTELRHDSIDPSTKTDQEQLVGDYLLPSTFPLPPSAFRHPSSLIGRRLDVDHGVGNLRVLFDQAILHDMRQFVRLGQ